MTKTKLKFIFPILLGIMLFAGCGSNPQNESNNKKAEHQRINERTDSINAIKKNNPIRFEKYLSKMEGTWVFEQTQPCRKLTRNGFGIKDSADGVGVCQKLKLIISGKTYKAYHLEYGVKNTSEVIIQSPTTYKLSTVKLNQIQEFNEENLLSEGNIELQPSNLGGSKDLNCAILICTTKFGTVCTEFGGNATGSWNSLYWDDTKGVLHWVFSRDSKCMFDGDCQRK